MRAPRGTGVLGSRIRHVKAIPSPKSLLRWVYVGRVSVATAIFVAAAFYFNAVGTGVIVTVATAAFLSVIVTGISVFATHVRGITPGPTFMYSQILFDLGLVTTVVHVTGGTSSDFASLYILVIAFTAVTMPVESTVLVAVLAAVLYFADGVWGQGVPLTVAIWLQSAVFGVVAFATAWLASRVRVIGDQREELEREVKRLRLEASDILREISGGIITVSGDGTLVFANAAAEQFLGFSAERYLRQPFLDFLSGRSQELWAAIFATQRDSRRLVRAEGMIRLAGRTFPVGVTTTLHRVEGQHPPSVTAIFTDISDQKRVNELNLRNERLEAVAELSASLAHEIKNPLASIRSSVEQLGNRPHADEDDKYLSELIVKESDRLSRLLTEFLDFSRVRMTESHDVDLRAVIGTAVDLVRGHPDCADGVVINTSNEPLKIRGDEDLLHRIVFNLVLNAVQAATGAVRIDVAARRLDLADLPSGVASEMTISLQVSDNGPGIPADIRERLFDPFVTRRVGGSGLGLAIVQRAVEAHSGLVFVDSDEGQGTRFSIYLPANGTREARS